MRIDAPKAEEIPLLWALWKEAFGDSDAFLATFEKNAFSPERCRCIVTDNSAAGKAVAALYWFDCRFTAGKIAYIYAVATDQAYRGQGLCRALMADTHRHLAALGYVGAILVPCSGDLFAFYERLGYTVCSHITEFYALATGKKIPLAPLDKEEYAVLRRRYLPKDGVWQEGENLEFLATQAELYAGDGFLLAARREEGELFGIELLGDIEKAPAILTTLGCDKGTFRTVGKDRPFAMYYPFTDDKAAPAYFGIAFD